MGSNLGDRSAYLQRGLQGLRLHLSDLRVSGVWETEPVGMVDRTLFLNACCTGRTRLTPRQLLSTLQDLERRTGRSSSGGRVEPRTLDLDLLLYERRRLDEPGLVVPHPRMRERAFVLLPLMEIADDWCVPGGSQQEERTVAELAAEVPGAGVKRTDIRLETS